MKILRPVILLMLMTAILPADDFTLKGTVRHVYSGDIIPEVNVYIKDTTFGTSSRDDGTFSLTVPGYLMNPIIVFEHIGYEKFEITLEQAARQDIFYLHPRVIPADEITIEATKEPPQILKDLPQSINVIAADRFEIRGYVDAGDLLRTEQSIQIEEEMSGKKTIAMRGGNADDVVILFNGIRLNRAFDNVFDLSLINLEDVQQIEIVKGSNTSLYGAEAFSGVVNIVPKLQKDYTARFQQKFGTYATAAWNLQLNRRLFNRLNLSYSYKEGSTKRKYVSTGSEGDLFINWMKHHTAHIVYDLSSGEEKSNPRFVSLMYLRTDLDYENRRFNENVNNLNQILSLRYNGKIGPLYELNMVGSYQWHDDGQSLSIPEARIDRRLYNERIDFNAEKSFTFTPFTLLMAYQFEQDQLDFRDVRSILNEAPAGIESALLNRQKHGGVAILKYLRKIDMEFINNVDLNVSLRHDRVSDRQSDVSLRNGTAASAVDSALLGNNTWGETTMKFSAQASALHHYSEVKAYMNVGTNVKFPTLAQQMSSPSSLSRGSNVRTNLNPEKNTSLEIGFEANIENKGSRYVNAWETSVNFFLNQFENKFRMYYLPGMPIAFFDNVREANLDGLELNVGLHFLDRRLMLFGGTSKYLNFEQAAFPFKSDIKHTIQMIYNGASYSVEAQWFHESTQTGWIRDLEGGLWEVYLPGRSDIDIHASKYFRYNDFTFFLNFSGRNLMGNQTELQGLALYDRRFYITLGVQY